MRRALLIVALLLAAPGTLPATAAITAAQPELRRIPLTLTTASGRHRFSVELARTPEQQEAGMMFRTAMARGRGMLFPFAPPRRVSFWMENTLLSLDLIFIGPDGRVLNVAADARPRSRDFLWSAGDAVAVLEVGAGEAARLRVSPGDRAVYKLPG